MMTNDRYLFRGFNKDENGKGTYYNLMFDDAIKENLNCIWEEQDFFEVIPETAGQFLDETDSDGHNLFWNDKIVVPILNNRVVDLNNKYVFSLIKNFIDNGYDFYYFKTIFDKEVK